MDMAPLSFRASIAGYHWQAEELLEAWGAGDPGAVQIVRHKHPRFLDDKIPWLPKRVSDAESLSVALDLADAELAVARWYNFENRPRLVE
jgi:hypothetical protein